MRFAFFVIITSLLACTFNTTKKVNGKSTEESSIEDIFLSLPDEAFPINEIYPTLSKVERQMILSATTYERATALYTNFMVKDEYGRNDGYLAFSYIASDEGISVKLKTWQRKDQSQIVGVIISYGDHCCDYSNLKLYQYKKGQFKEVTEKLFPTLKVEDFVPNIDAVTKALFPEKMEYSIQVSAENDFMEVSINHTPMFFDLEKDLDDRELKLVWEKKRFEIKKE